MGLIGVHFAPENGHCRSHRSSSALCQQQSFAAALLRPRREPDADQNETKSIDMVCCQVLTEERHGQNGSEERHEVGEYACTRITDARM
jgi:hypothetical protein